MDEDELVQHMWERGFEDVNCACACACEDAAESQGGQASGARVATRRYSPII